MARSRSRGARPGGAGAGADGPDPAPRCVGCRHAGDLCLGGLVAGPGASRRDDGRDTRDAIPGRFRTGHRLRHPGMVRAHQATHGGRAAPEPALGVPGRERCGALRSAAGAVPLPIRITPLPRDSCRSTTTCSCLYADRRRIIAEEHRPAVYTGNGVRPVVLLDGFARATWGSGSTASGRAWKSGLFGPSPVPIVARWWRRVQGSCNSSQARRLAPPVRIVGSSSSCGPGRA